MKKRFSGPQIVAKLRQADVLIGQGNGDFYRSTSDTLLFGGKRNLVPPALVHPDSINLR